MNPFELAARPFKNLTDAVTMPFQAIFVVGLCFFINWMTSPGYWWVKWVAFGMGIAVLVAWARALKTLAILGLLAAIGWFIYKRYGAQAREQYDAWRAQDKPEPRDLLKVVQMAKAA